MTTNFPGYPVGTMCMSRAVGVGRLRKGRCGGRNFLSWDGKRPYLGLVNGFCEIAFCVYVYSNTLPQRKTSPFPVRCMLVIALCSSEMELREVSVVGEGYKRCEFG